MNKNRFARGFDVASLALGVITGMTLGVRGASATSILIDDGATTYDPGTHLSWLDLTATAGQSYDAVAGGFGGYLSDGWRYASSGELGQLFSAAGGVGPFDSAYTVQNYAAASNLLSLLGILTTDFPFGTSKGLLSDSIFFREATTTARSPSGFSLEELSAPIPALSRTLTALGHRLLPGEGRPPGRHPDPGRAAAALRRPRWPRLHRLAQEAIGGRLKNAARASFMRALALLL